MVSKPDIMEYDIGNLMSFDPTPIAMKQIKKDHKVLDKIARDNTQLLINKLYAFPSTALTEEVGRMIELPPCTTKLPREKPVPLPKPETKWQKFAKLKGIQNKKRDRMIFDEEQQEFRPRYGYKRANDTKDIWVIEHKEGDDPTIDPFTKMEQEKREKVALNKKQQQSNLRRADGNKKAGKRGLNIPGAIDLASATQYSQSKDNDNKKTKGKRNAQHKEKIQV